MFFWYLVILLLGVASYTLFWLAARHKDNLVRAALQQPHRVNLGIDYTALTMRRVAIGLAAAGGVLLLLKIFRIL